MAHTPGPWFGLDDCVSSGLDVRGGSHHYPIARMKSYWDGPGPREDEAKANYALVTAAPDLLEALKRLLAYAEESHKMNNPDWSGEVFDDSDFGVARAAIAKAEGCSK